MRVSDQVGGPPDLARFFRDYECIFAIWTATSTTSGALVACYSRGDSLNELRAAFTYAIKKVVVADHTIRSRFGDHSRLFAHRGLYAEVFRDALVLLTFGLCLRVSRADIAAILECCERGDPLLETLTGAAAPGLEMPKVAPVFYPIFDRLYDALEGTEHERERDVREYLEVWYKIKMEGFSFKDTHLTEDQADYIGYWCFEAAGVVAALGIDDRTFADHPHYPRELVAFYRVADVS